MKPCLTDSELMMQMWENDDDKRKKWEMSSNSGYTE